MSQSHLFARALQIATAAHQDQTDKAGEPYLLHPLRIMAKFDREPEKIVALLHDVIEDSAWTLEALRDEGFSEEVLAALDALTRREAESYEEFIGRASQNPLARKIKLADLEDNMDIRRLHTITDRDIERLKKYHTAWLRLRD